jgi:outer membrane immunogenic protein
MRKLLVGMTALAWCCAAVSAHAADQRPAPLKAPPVPIATWSGFYLGLDAGFQSTRTDLTLTSIATVGGVLGPQTITPGGATTLPYDGTGARFGAFGGYNWQASPQWVFGAEADFGWTDNKTTLNGVAIGVFLLRQYRPQLQRVDQLGCQRPRPRGLSGDAHLHGLSDGRRGLAALRD